MTSRRGSSVAIGAMLLPYLLLFINQCGEAQLAPAPLLFGSLFDPTSGVNGTSALGLLALAHLQHKIDALAQLGELFGVVGANSTLLLS